MQLILHVLVIEMENIKKISDVIWEIPKTYKEGMLVPARIYASEKLLKEMDDGVFNQITNVACLPGIQKNAYCMPDGHWGYGFPIGGVAAFDLENGIISPGGIGFDINCGMRLIRTDLTLKEVQPRLKELVDLLFKMVPAGVGATAYDDVKGYLKLSTNDFKDLSERGADWAIDKGYGWEEDRERIEEHGVIKGADTSKVSKKAIERGVSQVGTLGSGNHYLEIQVVKPENIFDERTAKAFGVNNPNQIVVMVHCGSRGFGHQVASDYLINFMKAMPKYGLKVLDRELACAPFHSNEAQDYYKAMACAANMAFANRQLIVHRIRQAFEKIFKQDAESMGMSIVYDVAHNIAKIEEHEIDGQRKKVVMHRKGATRSFGPGHHELAPVYRNIGQPVIVGGSMETGSFLCVGTEKAMKETFGTTMHGSGRTMSRTKAKRMIRGENLQKEMEKKGIYVKSVSLSGLAEEAGIAYKNISEVVETMHIAGISKKVVALKPIGNVKG